MRRGGFELLRQKCCQHLDWDWIVTINSLVYAAMNVQPTVAPPILWNMLLNKCLSRWKVLAFSTKILQIALLTSKDRGKNALCSIGCNLKKKKVSWKVQICKLISLHLTHVFFGGGSLNTTKIGKRKREFKNINLRRCKTKKSLKFPSEIFGCGEN